MMNDSSNPLDLLDSLLKYTKTLGADAGDAVIFSTTDVNVSRRLRMPETLERSEASALGLRVFTGKKQAIASSTDLRWDSLKELAERAVAMAKSATEDADSSLAPEDRLARHIPDLDLFDGAEPEETWLIEQAAEAEEAALSTPGITNSEGADASYSSYAVNLVTSPRQGQGFAGSYHTSAFSFSVSVLAGEGTHMERDYDYAHARHRSDLPGASIIGANAARLALARLHPRKVQTAKVPVIFSPRVSKSMVGYFASAISGGAIARGTSFLKDKMGEQVFAHHINIIDDPHRIRGLASKPFDGEGVRNERLELVKDGYLTSWILDMRTANKLGLQTTGHASRGTGGPPSPSSTNLYMAAGTHTPEELIGDIKNGFYVTETFGMGVNLITGDYSQGASGFWVENGVITYPVSEVTIAGCLQDMFKTAIPANDLSFRYGTNCPTLRIEHMTVAGT